MQFPAGCVFPLENSVGAKWIAESAQRARKLLATRENNGWVIQSGSNDLRGRETAVSLKP
jgi:hypothetical protein